MFKHLHITSKTQCVQTTIWVEKSSTFAFANVPFCLLNLRCNPWTPWPEKDRWWIPLYDGVNWEKKGLPRKVTELKIFDFHDLFRWWTNFPTLSYFLTELSKRKYAWRFAGQTAMTNSDRLTLLKTWKGSPNSNIPMIPWVFREASVYANVQGIASFPTLVIIRGVYLTPSSCQCYFRVKGALN